MPHRQEPVVLVSDELYAPTGQIELCYQTFGSPEDPPLLLVMGLSAPMTWWPVELCEQLARAGFFVVRFDNRDVGRSTKLSAGVGLRHLARAFTTGTGAPPYTLGDMGDDAARLLDHLGLESAHVAGVSMGGMIAQTLALAHPQRVRSLSSIMSTTGRRTVGWQHPGVLPRLVTPRRDTFEAYVAQSLAINQLIGSPGYPTPESEYRRLAEETWRRGVDPAGSARQTLAILRQPDRTVPLRAARVPTLVVHGLADKMVHVSGGRATAAAVPGAELLLVDGMGHDLPPALFDTFTDAITRVAARA